MATSTTNRRSPTVQTKRETKRRTDQRTYKETHPWLTFELSFDDVPPEFWMLLGEIQSTCRLMSLIPLRPETVAKMTKIALVRGVHSTTAIEGNTLTVEQVEQSADGTLKLPESKEYLRKEVENILEICNEIDRQIVHEGGASPLTPARICELNGMVLKGLEIEEGAVAGRLRQNTVGVNKYISPPPEDSEYLLGRLHEWLETADFGEERLGTIAAGVLRAIAAHLYLVWIHPFGDGNGRIARLMEFQILLSAGLPTIAAHLISNHCNETRNMYYLHLDRVGREGGNPIEFFRYAMEGLRDGLEKQWVRVRSQLYLMTWEDHVFQVFGGKRGMIANRRRNLALDLVKAEFIQSISIDEVSEISPRVIRAYADRHRRTVQRDVEYLQGVGLVNYSDGRVSPNQTALFGILSHRGSDLDIEIDFEL